jgi:peptidylprolyl isomerase
LFTFGSTPAVTGACNLKKEPVVAAGGSNPPSQLTGADLIVGQGQAAVASDTVKVNYVGALYSNGKVFDASWTDQGPASFPLSGVVPGFKDAIVGMKVGGRRVIVIPPADGYGVAGSPPAIPGNATLIFIIDLLSITS